jgi:hypothetical protein
MCSSSRPYYPDSELNIVCSSFLNLRYSGKDKQIIFGLWFVRSKPNSWDEHPNNYTTETVIRSFPRSWLIIGFVTKVRRRVPHVAQELPTLPYHLSAPPVISGIRVARLLVFCAMFRRSLFFFRFSSSHYSVCPSNYGFLLPLWYLQTFHKIYHIYLNVLIDVLWSMAYLATKTQLYSSSVFLQFSL